MNDLSKLESIMKLMTLYKVDFIELDGIKVSKSFHEHVQLVQESKQTNEDADEELFYSAT